MRVTKMKQRENGFTFINLTVSDDDYVAAEINNSGNVKFIRFFHHLETEKIVNFCQYLVVSGVVSAIFYEDVACFGALVDELKCRDSLRDHVHYWEK